ncbi:translation elongation factor Ts [Sulfurovum sp. NBC37-1]|uniref:Elongation factor Ts n=1 Tax=Sulfurovum sp. (strain NBC37-1) TaxID=387093 RepID=EFTS_SULNB|nr:translation elongation factor Ts [Sulfurovum sp. NBC37-1]A6Q716.1 RecName: Full=Elongation factor Ts; Short=EF-Ts [Sulfurovum sp. NBC37-1]BAF71275.1 translation elongation factor Ts [Sulfurovum sp. NBC37-1]
MANFGPKDIKKLREMTDAGMMDCKKALTEADGDMDKAVEWLRDQGMGAAAKKAGKVAAEGAIGIKVEGHKAVIVEINSQTDFVAQNDKFKALMDTVVNHAFENNLADAEAINNSTINGEPFADFLSQQIAIIGEKLVVRRAALIVGDETTAVNGYVHSNAQNGVIIEAKCDSAKTAEAMTPVLKEVAMHAAAMAPSTLSFKDFDPKFVEDETKGRIVAIETENEELRRLGKTEKNVPQYISMSQLTDEVMAAAEEALKAELAAEGKPEKIWDKILPGKLARFISDNTTLDQEQCLLDQKFVMDDSKTVFEYVQEKAKAAGGSAEIVHFVRLEVGEGIEVEEEDFAAEVAKQMA